MARRMRPPAPSATPPPARAGVNPSLAAYSSSYSSGATLTLMGSFEVTFSSIEHSGQLMLSPTSSS